MAYTALYRKFRPLTFSEMVGQEHITKTIRNHKCYIMKEGLMNEVKYNI